MKIALAFFLLNTLGHTLVYAEPIAKSEHFVVEIVELTSDRSCEKFALAKELPKVLVKSGIPENFIIKHEELEKLIFSIYDTPGFPCPSRTNLNIIGFTNNINVAIGHTRKVNGKEKISLYLTKPEQHTAQSIRLDARIKNASQVNNSLRTNMTSLWEEGWFKDLKNSKIFYVRTKPFSLSNFREEILKFPSMSFSPNCAGSDGCIIHAINDGYKIISSYGVFIRPYLIIFYKIDKNMDYSIIKKFHVDALFFLHHLATNDLKSISMTHLYESGIARLYYWFSIQYGHLCKLQENQKTRLQLTTTTTTTYPYSQPVIQNRDHTYYTVEKIFATRAAQYGNWYVTGGFAEKWVKEGMEKFIKEYGCKSDEVKNVRKNLYKFGNIHDRMWKTHEFE